MRFDQTRIVIRRRGILEILDLSLLVTRIYAKPLLVSAMVLGLPLALVNAWLLHGVVAEQYSAGTAWRYGWLMLLLVFLQVPVASLPVTAVMGRVMFRQDVSVRSIADDLRLAISGVLWTQGVVRGGWLVLLLMLRLRPSDDMSQTGVWLVLVAAYSLLLRMIRPFINEIVILERTPVRSETRGTQTKRAEARGAQTRRTNTIRLRSRSLHRFSTIDLLGRWIVTAAAAITLTSSVALTLWFGIGLVTNDWRAGPLVIEWMLPLSFWMASVFTTVVKFIGYLDLRIRREGWEVELNVRAAARELFEKPEHQGQTT